MSRLYYQYSYPYRYIDQLRKFVVNLHWSHIILLSTSFKPGSDDDDVDDDDDEVMIQKSSLNWLKIFQQVGIG